MKSSTAKFTGRSCLAMVIIVVATQATRADDWPNWRGPQRDGVWREDGLIDKFDGRKIKIKWRKSIGSGYSGPTVANGRVYVTDRVVKPKQIERVHCFDEQTGKNIWTYTYDCKYRGVGYDAGPRASVIVKDGLAYSLGSMGNFFCFDAATGDVKWQKDLNNEYNIEMPIWGIAAAPIIEDDLIIVQIGGKPAANLVAFDKQTGSERWRALSDKASYSAPIIIDQAGKRVLVCYTGGNIVGLDPATGKTYWSQPFPPTQMVIGIASPVFYKDMIFVSSFFDGSLVLKLDQNKLAVTKLWERRGTSEKQTDALHTIISTPLIKNGYVYGIDSYGELRCLDLLTGDRKWEDLTVMPKARWATAHLVENGDRTWIFNEKGQLIIAELSPKGYTEISRSKLISPTLDQLRQRGGVCWSHPAFANKHVFARNDKQIVCASLAKQ